jgi:hypothetical protein
MTPGIGRRWSGAALRMALVLIVSAGTGCIFEVRDAQPPSSGSTWVVPDDPQRVFQNMVTGLEDLTGVNYSRSLNDAFVFSPTPEDSLNPTLAGKFVNWNLDVENEVTDIILSEASELQVSFTERDQIFDSSLEVKFKVRYDLQIVTNTVPPDTINYKGRAQFDMINGSKGWQLQRWRDEEREIGFATWGFLRGSRRP